MAEDIIEFSQLELKAMQVLYKDLKLAFGWWWVDVPVDPMCQNMQNAFTTRYTGHNFPYGGDFNTRGVAIVLRINNQCGYFLLRDHPDIYKWLRTLT